MTGDSPEQETARPGAETDGLENAPAAFIGMLEGRNFGKALVRVTSSA
jgi:NADPH-dependent curcumin reductase CurA